MELPQETPSPLSNLPRTGRLCLQPCHASLALAPREAPTSAQQPLPGGQRPQPGKTSRDASQNRRQEPDQTDAETHALYDPPASPRLRVHVRHHARSRFPGAPGSSGPGTGGEGPKADGLAMAHAQLCAPALCYLRAACGGTGPEGAARARRGRTVAERSKESVHPRPVFQAPREMWIIIFLTAINCYWLLTTHKANKRPAFKGPDHEGRSSEWVPAAYPSGSLYPGSLPGSFVLLGPSAAARWVAAAWKGQIPPVRRRVGETLPLQELSADSERAVYRRVPEPARWLRVHLSLPEAWVWDCTTQRLPILRALGVSYFS